MSRSAWAAGTEHHRLGAATVDIYFLRFWGLVVQTQEPASGEDSLPGLRTAAFLLSLHMAVLLHWGWGGECREDTF